MWELLQRGTNFSIKGDKNTFVHVVGHWAKTFPLLSRSECSRRGSWICPTQGNYSNITNAVPTWTDFCFWIKSQLENDHDTMIWRQGVLKYFFRTPWFDVSPPPIESNVSSLSIFMTPYRFATLQRTSLCRMTSHFHVSSVCWKQRSAQRSVSVYEHVRVEMKDFWDWEKGCRDHMWSGMMSSEK